MSGNLGDFGSRVSEGLGNVRSGAQEFDTARTETLQAGATISEQLAVRVAAANQLDTRELGVQLSTVKEAMRAAAVKMRSGASAVYGAMGVSSNQHAVAAQNNMGEALAALGGGDSAPTDTYLAIAGQLQPILTDEIPALVEYLQTRLTAAQELAGRLSTAQVTTATPQIAALTETAAQQIGAYGDAIGVDFGTAT